MIRMFFMVVVVVVVVGILGSGATRWVGDDIYKSSF
jgi:hypothetical protein